MKLNPAFWQQTAIPGSQLNALKEEKTTDVVIVGAGITGLRAAIELAERDLSVIVLDKYEPGWGASGRTGGQVNPLGHATPQKIIEQLGNTFGPRMVETYINSGDELFNLIKKYKLQCEATQNGWIRGAHCDNAIKQLEDTYKGWSKYGLNIDFVEGRELHRMVGSDAYSVATYVKSGGCIQPLSYTRELARVAISKGVSIFTQSAVTHLKPKNKNWHVSTKDGGVTSQWVLFCTNGYTDNTLTGLKQTIIPLVSVQAATRPLSTAEYNQVLPYGNTLSDTRRVIYYARKDNRNRLLIGSLGFDEACNKADKRRLEKALTTVFPQLSPSDLEIYWGGRIAFTPDVLPHLHEPAPGILAGLGYNGRGVAMGTVMGRILAQRVAGMSPEDLPVKMTRMKPFPFHRFHKMGVYGAIKSYEMRDALDVKFF